MGLVKTVPILELNIIVSCLLGSPDSLRGSRLVLGSSRDASLGKLQSQPSTSTCSPSPVTVREGQAGSRKIGEERVESGVTVEKRLRR